MAPFIPVLIGIILKVSLIDDVPTKSDDRHTFIIETYLTPMWLEFLVVAYILPVGLFLKGVTINPNHRTLMYISPAIAFVICALFFLAAPKFGIFNIWIVIGVPTIISGIVLLLMGYLVRSP